MNSLRTDYVNVDSLYSAVSSGKGGLADVAGVGFTTDSATRLTGSAADGAGGRRRFGDSEEATPLCPSLSYQTRLIGFAMCVGLGFLLGIFSWITAFTGSGGTFAVIYTFSNLFSIGSTLFLCGPVRQLKNMVKPTRLIATIVFVLMMILTFVFAIAVKIAWLTIITVLLQYVAMAWYALSYIPFARDAIRSCLPCGK